MSPVARIQSLFAHPGVRRYVANSGWLMLEQALRAGLNIVVGVYVARYLGPEQYGVFNYIVAIALLGAVAARLGLDGILLRELIARPEENGRDLGAVFWTMNAGAVGASILVLLVLASGLTNQGSIWFTVLVLPIILVQPLCVVDFYCQSKVRAMVPAICRIIVMIASAILKVVAIAYGADLMSFFVITAIEQLILAASYIVAALTISIPRFWLQFSKPRALDLLKSAWPLLLHGIAFTLYIRINLVILGLVLDEKAVGLYSAASRVYDAWTAVVYVLATSMSPALLNARARSAELYHERLILLTKALFWSSAGLTAAIAFGGRELIILTFGPAFIDAYASLVILMAASAFIAMGSVSARYLIFEGREKGIVARTALAATVNVAGSLIMTPLLGVNGAALALLLASAVSNYGFDYLNPLDRELVRIKNTSLLFFLYPIRR
jgi:O-antigen/teichoic acid export membrane protein